LPPRVAHPGLVRAAPVVVVVAIGEVLAADLAEPVAPLAQARSPGLLALSAAAVLHSGAEHALEQRMPHRGGEVLATQTPGGSRSARPSAKPPAPAKARPSAER